MAHLHHDVASIEDVGLLDEVFVAEHHFLVAQRYLVLLVVLLLEDVIHFNICRFDQVHVVREDGERQRVVTAKAQKAHEKPNSVVTIGVRFDGN